MKSRALHAKVTAMCVLVSVCVYVCLVCTGDTEEVKAKERMRGTDRLSPLCMK